MSETQWRKHVKFYSSHVSYGLRQLRKSRAVFEPLLQMLIETLPPDPMFLRRLKQFVARILHVLSW